MSTMMLSLCTCKGKGKERMPLVDASSQGRGGRVSLFTVALAVQVTGQFNFFYVL